MDIYLASVCVEDLVNLTQHLCGTHQVLEFKLRGMVDGGGVPGAKCDTN